MEFLSWTVSSFSGTQLVELDWQSRNLCLPFSNRRARGKAGGANTYKQKVCERAYRVEKLLAGGFVSIWQWAILGAPPSASSFLVPVTP